MRLVFFRFGCGPTMEGTEVVDCEGMTEEELNEMAYDMAIDEANTYGSFFCEDEVPEDDEGYDGYIFTDSDLSYDFEDYVPEKHDMYRCGGGCFLDQFKDEPGFQEWLTKQNF